MDKVRVLVVADDSLVRAGIFHLLQPQNSCFIVGQISERELTHNSLQLYQPDLILWDLGWEVETEQLEHLAELAEGELPIVVLLADTQSAGSVWQAGVRGILPREVSAGTLAHTLTTVHQGLIVLDPLFAHPIFPTPPSENPLSEPLTPREKEVLQLIAEGLPNKLIAQKLHISDHTVKFHITAIMGKLNVQSRTEAVVRATRLGLITI